MRTLAVSNVRRHRADACAGSSAGDETECVPHPPEQFLPVERLGQKTEYALLACRDSIGNRAVCGEDNDRNRRRLGLQMPKQRQSVHRAHAQIGDDEPGAMRAKKLECRIRPTWLE